MAPFATDGTGLVVWRNYTALRASFRAANSGSATVVWEGVTGPRQDPLQQTIRMARRPLR